MIWPQMCLKGWKGVTNKRFSQMYEQDGEICEFIPANTYAMRPDGIIVEFPIHLYRTEGNEVLLRLGDLVFVFHSDDYLCVHNHTDENEQAPTQPDGETSSDDDDYPDDDEDGEGAAASGE